MAVDQRELCTWSFRPAQEPKLLEKTEEPMCAKQKIDKKDPIPQGHRENTRHGEAGKLTNGNGTCLENDGKKKHGKQPIDGVPSMAFYALLNNQLVLNPEFGQGHNSHKCGGSMLFSSTASLLCIYVFLPKDSKGRMRHG